MNRGLFLKPHGNIMDHNPSSIGHSISITHEHYRSDTQCLYH